MDEPTVVLAPDKFKGCLTAAQVADALAAGIRDVSPEVRIRTVPVADGGDGTVAALLARGWRPLDVTVTGPDGAPVVARTAVRGRTAVVESSATSGLRLLQGRGLRPLTAGSRGVGEAIGAAVDAGARRVVVGVGGTACTDGGAGMLAALGARLLDGRGRPVPDGGAGLAQVATVDLEPARERLAGVEVIVATDVDNPLLGADGAAAVYGPQKGATADDVLRLDEALSRWADVVGVAPDLPGAGAGGGLAYGLMAGLGGTVRSGVDLVLELVGFHREVAAADLVVTGEGCLDEQSLRGKAVIGVVRATREGRAGALPPVVAVCGVNRLGADASARVGLARVWSLVDRAASTEDSLARAPVLLREVGRELIEVLPR
ncbi:glycerate kinase [Actinotalea sp. Marseille-Q4924]|uniref:glycerate kinase n=1 Tax=Actinotalea sp. Marseille-Q4924 TaxID=2866571 RepID=UPI001CE47A81|nr:glycerate kinase [Actinotalea sp. Marseille-Q4924]